MRRKLLAGGLAAAVLSAVVAPTSQAAAMIGRWSFDESGATNAHAGDSASALGANNGVLTSTSTITRGASTAFTGAGNALTFNGLTTGGYVAVEKGTGGPQLQADGITALTSVPTMGLAAFTVSTHFIRTGAGVGASTGSGGIATLEPLVAKGNAQADASNVDANYVLGISTVGGVRLGFDYEDTGTGLNHPITGTTTITNGVWHHAAATYEAGTLKIYLDGNLEGTLTGLTGGLVPRSDSIQPLSFGAMLQSNGTSRNGALAGSLDEVQIYDFATDQAGIDVLKTGAPLPEPGTLSLLGVSAGLLLGRRRRHA